MKICRFCEITAQAACPARLSPGGEIGRKLGMKAIFGSMKFTSGEKMKPAGRFLLLIMVLAASTPVAEIKNVLHYSKKVGRTWRSGNAGCTKTLNNLAAEHGFSVTHSENEADILNLEEYDLVVYDNTVSDGGGQSVHPSDLHQRALRDYIEGGGLWLGFGGASDYDCKGWEWYHQVLFSGICFKGNGGGTLTLEIDADLDADLELSTMWRNAGLGDSVTFDAFIPRLYGEGFLGVRSDPDVKVLQKLIESDGAYEDHVVTWTKPVGRGRMLYTALGHQEMDYTQNDKWLERAAWHWMQYLDGQYGISISVRGEGGRLKGLGQESSKTGRARIYGLNGRLVADLAGGADLDLDFFRTVEPGIYFGKLQSPSGATTKTIVIP